MDLTLYNSSDIHYSLFDISIEFEDMHGEKYSNEPYDDTQTIFASGRYNYRPFSTIELEPKKLKLIHLDGCIQKDDLKKYTKSINIKKIVFVAKNHKNGIFRKKLLG